MTKTTAPRYSLKAKMTDDDTLKSEWVDLCLTLARRPSNLYQSSRKIVRIAWCMLHAFWYTLLVERMLIGASYL